MPDRVYTPISPKLLFKLRCLFGSIRGPKCGELFSSLACAFSSSFFFLLVWQYLKAWTFHNFTRVFIFSGRTLLFRAYNTLGNYLFWLRNFSSFLQLFHEILPSKKDPTFFRVLIICLLDSIICSLDLYVLTRFSSKH